MFYITTPNGISISDAGRAPLFVGKSHPSFETILKNIKNLTYNQIQDELDLKNKVVGYISDDVETYFNENDDLEIQVNVSDSAQNPNSGSASRELQKDALFYLQRMLDIDDEDDCSDKAKRLLNMIKDNSLSLVGIKLIFE